jgi:hypothetical protein
MNWPTHAAPYVAGVIRVCCEGFRASLGGGSIVVAGREAIARGDRHAALRLLRALTLSEPKAVVIWDNCEVFRQQADAATVKQSGTTCWRGLAGGVDGGGLLRKGLASECAA